MKKTLSVIAVLAFASVSEAAPLVLPATGKIAVLGFALDNSIVMKGAERDGGPGILQKPEEYYRTHQAIVDSMWTIFKDTASAVFAGLDYLPLDSFKNDAAYNEASRCVPKKLMGKIVLPCRELEPKAGANAIPELDKPKMNDWAKKNGIARYFVLRSQAEYFLSAGAGVNDVVAGAGKMRVETYVFLVEPGKGVVWTSKYTNQSNSSAMIVNDLFPESNWIMATEAFRANLEDFSKVVAKAKTP